MIAKEFKYHMFNPFMHVERSQKLFEKNIILISRVYFL